MKNLKYHLILCNEKSWFIQKNQEEIKKRVFMDLRDKPPDSIEISYGKGKINFQIPKDRYKYFKPLAFHGINGSENIKTTLINALENPINSKPLDILVKNKKVTYLVEDSTDRSHIRNLLMLVSQNYMMQILFMLLSQQEAIKLIPKGILKLLN